MKKILIAVLAMGLICARNVNVFAQETTVSSEQADKISEEEAKRLQEEEEKAMKEYEKMLEEMEKDQKKYEKRVKREAEFREFISTWEPVNYSDIDSTKMPNVVDFFKYSNEFFTTMSNVYSYIDYIHVETNDTVDAEGVEVTEVKQLGKDGEELEKGARTVTTVKATADLTLAGLQAANVILSAPLAITDLTSDPLLALSLGKRIKKTLATVKMGIAAIPLLKYKVNDNKAARRQLQNN
ncbi:MAG TPA: hypothetical protein H9859_05415 [Candidatus Barnesiella excrementigallinarum]|nr:hypothetical protein [Candidatus Barnesiella excrementigallinarum]